MQYNMETDVIESLLKKDRSEVILSKCLPCGTKLYIFVGPLCNLIVKDLNFTAFFYNHSVLCFSSENVVFLLQRTLALFKHKALY